MKFNDVIINERKARNLTQKDFARLLNVSDKTISKWETGVSIPDLETLLLVSKVLGVPIIERILDDSDSNETDKHERFCSELADKFRFRQYLIISLFIVSLLISFLFRSELYRMRV